MEKIALYIWQLPQIIVALIYGAITWYNLLGTISIQDCVLTKKRYGWNMAFGNFIFIKSFNESDSHSLKNCFGHVRLSELLGPLYLFVIIIPYIIWRVFRRIVLKNQVPYYKFYTEIWADKLGNVIRK